MKDRGRSTKLPDLIAGIAIVCAGLLGIYYTREAARDVLMMDYWRIAGRLIPPIMNNELTVSDLFQSDWGQSNPLLYFLLSINIKYFGLNCLLSEYFAVGMMMLSAVIVYITFRGAMKGDEKNEFLRVLLFLPMLLCVFNYNQKEILSIQFAFVFMFRVMSYLLIFHCVDYWLRNMDKRSRFCFVFSCLLVICAICLWSQLYFPAMCGATLAVVLFDIVLRRKRNHKERVFRYVIWTLCVFLGMLLYVSYVRGISGEPGGLSAFIRAFLSGDVIYGCCVMLLAAILPGSMMAGMSRGLIMAAGVVIIGIILGCLIVYVRQRMYEKTYFPLLLLLYGGGSIFVIEYGRLSKYGPTQMRSSRYVCETTLIYIGVIMILALCVYQNSRVQKYLAYVIIGMLFISISDCNWREIRAAGAQGAHKDRAIARLREIADGDEVVSEDVSLFQVNSLSELKKGMRYLTKFHLSVFSGDKYFGKISSSEGISGDGWVQEENRLTITAGAEGKIIAYLYNPYWEEYEGHNVFVLVDGIRYGSYPVSQDMEVELKLEPEREYTLSFQCDYEARVTPPDERRLYFILTDIFGM